MSNPMLNEARWDELSRIDRQERSAVSTTMTVNGTVTKTAILLGLMLATIAGMWHAFWPGVGAMSPALLYPLMIGGAIGGFVLVLIASFAPRSAPITAPLYAVAEGLFLGGLTMIFQKAYPGLAVLAAVCTAAVLLALLGLYRVGIIRASDRFIRGVFIATAGAAFAMLAIWLLSMFTDAGASAMQALRGGGPIGIGFSALMIVLAAANLVVDFGLIERGARASAPKVMEWMGALGLMVTLVWLYIEILHLLAKLRGRD